MIDTTELKRRYGPSVQTRHLRALNKLTILANQGTDGCTLSLARIGCGPIPSNHREVHRNLLEAEFKKFGHSGPINAAGSWAPDAGQHTIQLIKEAFSHALQAPVHPGDSINEPLDITILPKARRSRKRKPDPAYAIRHTISITSAEPVQVKQVSKRGKTARMKAAPPAVTMVTEIGKAGVPLEDWLHKCSQDTHTQPLQAGWASIPQTQDVITQISFHQWRKKGHVKRVSEIVRPRKGIFISHSFNTGGTVHKYPLDIRRSSPSHGELERLYGDQNHMWRVLAKCLRSGREHFLVRWQPTFMLTPHINEYKKIQYVPEGMTRVTQFGPQVSKWLKLVSWKASWEPQESVCQHPHLEADILALKCVECRPAQSKPWPRSHDHNLSNLDRQSFFNPSLIQRPALQRIC